MGLKIFIACVTISTFVIGTVWMMGDGLTGGLKRSGTVFLGGDLAITVVNVPLEKALQSRLAEVGEISRVAELRSSISLIAAKPQRRVTVEVKGVDDAYPLFGKVSLESGRSISEVLNPGADIPAAIVEPSLLRQTGVSIGDDIAIGGMTFKVADVMKLEPDRLSAGRFLVGPRIVIALQDLERTPLLNRGSVVDYRYRLKARGDSASAIETVKGLRPEAGWELETPKDAGDRVIRTVERTTTFLGMAGIVALAIGLAGMWASSKAWISRRGRTIALYRLSGALPSTTLSLHASIMAIASMIGFAIGLAMAAVLSFWLVDLIAARLHLTWLPTDLFKPLLEVVWILVIGIIGTSTLALSGAIQVPPGAAMRSGDAAPVLVKEYAGFGLVFILIAMLAAILTLPIPWIAAVTEMGLLVLVFLLVIASAGLARLWQIRTPRGFIGTIIKQGLSRTGSVAGRAVAIGIGIAGITAIIAAQNSLELALRSELPDKIPDLVLIDVQPDQVAKIKQRVTDNPNLGGLQANPYMRMTITKVNGIAAEDALVRQDKSWVIEGDRSFSWTAEPTEAELLAGSWWPKDYDGPPLLSPEEDLQEAFNLKPGDKLTYSFLGRTFTSEVVNIRKEYHRTFRPEFLLMVSPNPFKDAPQSWIMSLQGQSKQVVDDFIRETTAAQPNITAIDIRQIVAQVTEVVEGAVGASLLIASILIVAGGLSLAAIVAAEVDARRREALVFTLIGASRMEISIARLGEAVCIGLIAALVGGLMGYLGGFWLVEEGLRVSWAPGYSIYVLPVALGIFASVVAGLAGGVSAAPSGRGQMARLLTS